MKVIPPRLVIFVHLSSQQIQQNIMMIHPRICNVMTVGSLVMLSMVTGKHYIQIATTGNHNQAASCQVHNDLYQLGLLYCGTVCESMDCYMFGEKNGSCITCERCVEGAEEPLFPPPSPIIYRIGKCHHCWQDYPVPIIRIKLSVRLS